MSASGPTGTDRRQYLVTAGACLFVALLGVLRIGGIGGIGGGPPEMASEPSAGTGETASGDASRERQHAERKQPDAGMTLVVPRIGLDAPAVELGVGDDDTLEAPRRFDRVGWWAGGPRPGDAGPAVLVGHVDSAEGPAVFKRLPELLPGDEVVVRQKDGPATRFVVTRSEQLEKSRFSTAQAYGEVAEPELRLITCTGYVDRSARHCTDNLIVYASLTP